MRGQNNVQGASDAGLVPMFLPDYQSVTDEGVRSAFNSIWGSDNIASEKGLTVVEIMDAVHPSGIGGTYGGNPIACAAALSVFDIFKIGIGQCIIK